MGNSPVQPQVSVAPAAQPGIHPAFGPGPIAIVSGENPLYPQPAGDRGHQQMGQALQQMGLQAEATRGKYGAHEPSWVVYGASIPQLQELGKRFGQEAVTVRMNGKNFFLYTNGPKEGHASVPVEGYEQYSQEPEDYYTVLPGQKDKPAGYFKYNMDLERPAIPLHALDQHLKTVPAAAAAQAVLKSVVESYHNVLLGVRMRELAKAEGKTRAKPGCAGKCVTCGEGFDNNRLAHECQGCGKKVHSTKCSMNHWTKGNHCLACAKEKLGGDDGRSGPAWDRFNKAQVSDKKRCGTCLGCTYGDGECTRDKKGVDHADPDGSKMRGRKKLDKAQAGEQVAPHREPGIHEPSGSPHMEPGIHEKPAPAAKPEKRMQKSKVFDLVKSQVMSAPKTNGGPVKLGKEERCPTCGTHNPNIGPTTGTPGGAEVQPAAPAPNVGPGQGGIPAPKTQSIPGMKPQPAEGVGKEIVSPQSGQMPTQLPKAGQDVAGRGEVEKGEKKPEDGKCCERARAADRPCWQHTRDGKPRPTFESEKVCSKCGGKGVPSSRAICDDCFWKTDDMGKQETNANKMARANGGSMHVCKSEGSLKLLGLIKKELFPEPKPYKKWSGTGGDITAGKKLGKEEKGASPKCDKCGRDHKTGDHATVTLFEDPEPKVLHPSDKKKVKKGEQQPQAPAAGGKPQAQPKVPAVKPAGIPAAPKPPGAPGMTKGAMSYGAGGRMGGADAAEGARNASFQAQTGTPTEGPAPKATPKDPSEYDAEAFRPASPGAASVRTPAMLRGIRRGQPAVKAERPMSAPQANGGEARKA